MRQLPKAFGPWWVAIPALGGASAALALPGLSPTTSAGASVLAVGALAVLAGHTWGLLVVVASHVTLVGRLWPSLAHAVQGDPGAPPGGVLGEGAIAVVLVTALPALALLALLLPTIVEHVLGRRSPRVKGLAVAGLALLGAVALVLPAF
jgi:hypothetical protein